MTEPQLAQQYGTDEKCLMKWATLVPSPECPKEEGVPAERSALPTHTGTHASQAHSWMRHRLEYSRWLHAKSLLGTSDISLEGPFDSLVAAVPHLPLSPMAAAICSGRFILRRWRMALTLPALLMNCILNISCYCRLQAAYRNYTINLVTAMAICLGQLLAGTKAAHGTAGVTQTWPHSAGECSTSALDALLAPSLFLKTNQSKVDHL